MLSHIFKANTYRLLDPFIGFNEIQAEWVGETSWIYRLILPRPSLPANTRAVLAFDGLDTFAHVTLNGKTILQSDNMFLSHRVDITEAIKAKLQEHVLEVDFSSALLKAREIRGQHPDHKFLLFNGEPARLAVRKAQYHWGWDWGPIVMCAGIWRPVRLEVYSARIAELRSEVKMAKDFKSAVIDIDFDVEIDVKDINAQQVKADICLRLGSVVIISKQSITIGSDNKVHTTIQVENPELWMPSGYGAQTLYSVSATLSSGQTTLHEVTKRIGFRELELIQKADNHGKSFYFRVNGVDIFCAGSCWIPTDSILTNINPEKYRAWLELMIPANQKMIR